jgi:hypothetical protein
MGKQRREQPQDSIFANKPFVDGFFEWMGSREGQQCIKVRDVLWDLLEDVQLDAEQRQLIWPDAERLDLEQSITDTSAPSAAAALRSCLCVSALRVARVPHRSAAQHISLPKCPSQP